MCSSIIGVSESTKLSMQSSEEDEKHRTYYASPHAQIAKSDKTYKLPELQV